MTAADARPCRARITARLNPDRAVCALRGGRLIGPVGYWYPGRALTGGTAGDVLRPYATISDV
ncbi:hypothetical protein [Streptomyces sp. Ncost-T10-10d]|uniref:hypothetical protein n=1 Tax=Streptomyces sp. Ncost-T10-10d TaxID=1839774 RepID=UPI00114D3553|nr:hypothetical protein [Streptomyces sp. Ncost-T10-10d]